MRLWLLGKEKDRVFGLCGCMPICLSFVRRNSSTKYRGQPFLPLAPIGRRWEQVGSHAIKRNYLRPDLSLYQLPFLFHPDSDPIIRKGTEREREGSSLPHSRLVGGLAIFINLGAEQLGAPSPISARLSVTTRTEWAYPSSKGRNARKRSRDRPASCRAPFSSPKVSIIPNPLAPASAIRPVSLHHDHLFPVLVSRRLQLQRRSGPPPLIPTTDSPTNGATKALKSSRPSHSLRPSLLIKRSR